MDDREVICENCNREVPSENYPMHFVHCKRNIQLCSLCGEAVLRSEEMEHFEEYHAETNCVQCGHKTTRCEEGNHLANECGKRPILCQYCEISLPRERMTEHQELCGSRTELCHKCSRYVLIRDFQNHDKFCDGSASRSSAALPCEFCCSPIRPDKLDAHQRQCLVERQGLQAPLLVEGDDGLFRAIATGAARTGSHESARTRGGIGTHDHFSRVTRRDSDEAQAERNSIVALPCEICGELCPSDRLMQHQDECSQELERETGESTLYPTASGREESDQLHFRFSRIQRNRPNREMDDSFDDFTIEGSPYGILANVFRDLEERRWPFEMMRNLWSHTDE